MAKVSFTKLGLSKNTSVNIVNWNDQEIEIKQYLPIEDKLALIEKIVNLAVDNTSFYNSCRIDLYMSIEIILAYTNLNVTDKQKEDYCKLYDLFFGSGFNKVVFDNIPKTELDYIITNSTNITQSVYNYKTSALGILDVISQDYSNINLDASNVQQLLTDPKAMQLVKELATKVD